MVECLIATEQIDFLIRDSRGRLASTQAWMVGRNSALAKKLMEKEIALAEAQGIDYRALL